MAVVNFVLYNAALAGFMAGLQSQRLQILEASGAQTEPADFAPIATAGVLFATEVDAILQTVVSPPANIARLVSGGATAVPATATVANAAESLPSAMCAMSKAAWEGRSLPSDPATQLPFTQADYQPVANAVVALFVEYAANTSNA
jgi:hypothetical protein